MTKIFFLLVVLAAIGYAGFLGFSDSQVAVGQVSSERSNELWRKYEQVASRDEAMSGKTEILSSAETSALLNRVLELNSDEGGSGFLAPKKIIIELLPANELRAVLRYQFFDRFVSDLMIVGKVESVEQRTAVRFRPEQAKIGELPMKWFLQDLVAGHFNRYFTGQPDLDKARQNIEDVKIDRNRLTVVIKSF